MKRKKENENKLKKIETRLKLAIVTIVPMMMSVTVYAADDPLTVVNNLNDFIFKLIKAIGMIILGFGAVQIGMSFKSHDPSQRSNGVMSFAGGIIIYFAKEIITKILG